MVRVNMPRTSKDQRTVRLLDVCWSEGDQLMGRIYLDMTVVTLPMEALVLLLFTGNTSKAVTVKPIRALKMKHV